MSFAENLKQIRKEKNISQEKLAELLDVSRQAVSEYGQFYYTAKAHKLQGEETFWSNGNNYRWLDSICRFEWRRAN